MTAINDQYINALLADAAYAKDLAEGMDPAQLRDALKTSMTPTLADFISANFTVVSNIDSGDVFESGFDATVWRGNAGSDYAGQVYVSMQGTKGLGDWFTDMDIAASGIALAQYETMVNWWLRISTPVGQTAKQVAFVEGQGFVAAPSVAGTGQVAGVGSVFVNGHSLGGNLATGFARLFGGSVTIDHVTTFNSPGFLSGIYGSGHGTADTPVAPTAPPALGAELARGFAWVAYELGATDAATGATYAIVGAGNGVPLGESTGNVIDGGAGNDRIYTGTADDVAHGGDGNDLINGMAGTDVLSGDAGNGEQDLAVADWDVRPAWRFAA